MKNHFNSLFDPSHRWWTISFFLAAILLIYNSFRMGVSNNLPANLQLILGMGLFYYSLIHSWEKWQNYAIMAILFTGIICLAWITFHFLNLQGSIQIEAEKWILRFIGFVCFPNIIIGFLGAIFCARKGS